MGGHRHLWVLCVGGGGLGKRSHVTGCDNGIMFVSPHEITRISHMNMNDLM